MARRTPTCNDYGKRKGCGAEIKLIQDETGKWKPVEKTKYPVWDDKGKLSYKYLPHWVVCPKAASYREKYLEDKAKQAELFRQKQGAGSSNPNVSRLVDNSDIPF